MAFTAASPFASFAHYLSSTPRVLMVSHREIAERRYAKPPHGSFTPTAVLTEPPPLRDPYDVFPRRHCGWTGVPLSFRLSSPYQEQHLIPAAGYFALLKRGSRRTKLSWLVLSHIIGTDVSANVYSVLVGTNKVLTIQLLHGNAETKLR